MSNMMSNINEQAIGLSVAPVEVAITDEINSLKAKALKIGYLSAMDLFSDLTAEEKEELHRSIIMMQTCKAGRVFYTPGETGEVLFILKEGAVQIYRMSSEGRKIVIARLRPFSFFGEMSCVGQGMYDTFAEAIEDSLICMMSRADFQRVILAKPRVALRILEALGNRMAEVERQLEDLAFKGVIPRIASLLLKEANGDEVTGLSHQDIADWLGIYRETATTVLNELKNAGIIEIGRRRIAITDRKRLERAASE